MSELPENWQTLGPDLVRDNRLMHERLAEQDRQIERLTRERDEAWEFCPTLREQALHSKIKRADAERDKYKAALVHANELLSGEFRELAIARRVVREALEEGK